MKRFQNQAGVLGDLVFEVANLADELSLFVRWFWSTNLFGRRIGNRLSCGIPPDLKYPIILKVPSCKCEFLNSPQELFFFITAHEIAHVLGTKLEQTANRFALNELRRYYAAKRVKTKKFSMFRELRV